MVAVDIVEETTNASIHLECEVYNYEQSLPHEQSRMVDMYTRPEFSGQSHCCMGTPGGIFWLF